jgi:hypothetical protein
MKKSILFSLAIAAVSLFGSCANDVEMNYPSTHKLSNLPVVEGVHDGVKAPLYWSVYEYCMLQNAKGVSNADMDLTSDQWDKIIDYVATNLKPSGYDMICTDGFIPMLAKDESGYMTHYGSQALKDIAAKRTEINCHLVGVVIAIEDTKHIVAIGHLSIPYLIVLVVELVAERLAHETILVEGEQLIVGIILHVIANRRWQVGGCDWATSHQLQGRRGCR